MTISLPSSVLKTLPEPDTNGLVRVVVALQVGQDGDATVSEINDVPVTGSDSEETAENSSGEDDSMGQDQGPSADEIDSMVYNPSAQPQTANQ